MYVQATTKELREKEGEKGRDIHHSGSLNGLVLVLPTTHAPRGYSRQRSEAIQFATGFAPSPPSKIRCIAQCR